MSRATQWHLMIYTHALKKSSWRTRTQKRSCSLGKPANVLSCPWHCVIVWAHRFRAAVAEIMASTGRVGFVARLLRFIVLFRLDLSNECRWYVQFRKVEHNCLFYAAASLFSPVSCFTKPSIILDTSIAFAESRDSTSIWQLEQARSAMISRRLAIWYYASV